MPSGYTVSGRGDLDALFKARTGTARANVGYQVGGVDLAQRYEQRSTAAITNTGYTTTGGTDLAQLFENITPSAIEEVIVLTPGYVATAGAFSDLRGVDKGGGFGLTYNVSSGSPFPNGLVLRLWTQSTEVAAPAGANQSLVVGIEGFASDPGQGWLNWARSAGVEKSGAAASLYEFFAAASPKWARWGWARQGNNWGFATGTPITVRIGHAAP